MREAMELVLDHAFGPLALHRIEANIQPGNAPSIALARGAGFRLEGFSPRYLLIGGRWRDHERYAITADEHARQAARLPRTARAAPGRAALRLGSSTELRLGHDRLELLGLGLRRRPSASSSGMRGSPPAGSRASTACRAPPPGG